jgi:methylated-DNA-[protein]-cysteine S-methyltransferase
MTALSYTLFATPIGACGIVWNERGVAGLQLPEGDATKARARLLRRFSGARETAPPARIQHAIDRIVALLSGAKADLTDVVLDMQGIAPFRQQVYAITRTIRPGETLTYGEIAEKLGDKRLARDVGEAMGKNPFPIVVPCHRVVASNGKLGGFSARGGVDTKLRILAIEGAAVGGQPTLF